MKNRAGIAFIIYIFAAALTMAQRSPSTYDPARQAGQQHSQKPQPGFLESTLKRINPAEKDYGEWLEQARSQAIETGMRELPMVLACVLIGWSFLVILHQNKERKHREIIAARFLAWYHNELVRARETVHDAIIRNHRLKKAIDERPEPEGEPKAALPATATAAAGVSLVSQKRTPEGDHELMTELNALRQKNAAYEATEKTLRQQISRLNRTLEEEKQKNLTLRGE